MRTILGTAALALGAAAAIAQTQGPAAPETAVPLDPVKVFSDNCAACHQENGRGVEGAFPALAGDKFVQGAPAAAIQVVLEGRAGMPTFKADLTDAQIAAALTHVRTSWGNKASAVTAAEVAALRSNTGPRPEDKKPLTAH